MIHGAEDGHHPAGSVAQCEHVRRVEAADHRQVARHRPQASTGLVASVSDFLYRNGGNIVHADQYTSRETEIGVELSVRLREGRGRPG